MRRLIIVLALAAGVMTPAAGALASAPSASPPPGSPAGSIGIRIIDAPADRQDDPRARLYVIDHIDLGGSIERRIEVSNTTDETQQVTVYSAGATIANGSFRGDDGSTQNALSSWTTLDQGAIEIGADSTAIVTVAVDVPLDAPPGEQYAVIWAEARAAPPAGGGVTVVNRVGIRMYVDVGPGGEAASAFSITELTAARTDTGQPMVTATVTNTGGRALDMSGSLLLANGPGGLTAGPFDAALGTTLAPGDTGPVAVAFDALLPNGPWDAQIELHSGLLSGTAEATITFPDAGDTAPAVATSDDGISPWIAAVAGALGLLVVAALARWLWLWRRRRRDDPAGPAASTPVLVGAAPL